MGIIVFFRSSASHPEQIGSGKALVCRHDGREAAPPMAADNLDTRFCYSQHMYLKQTLKWS